MSTNARQWAHEVLLADATIPRPARTALLVLADMAGVDRPECWPSLEHIGRLIGNNPRNAWRAINELRSRGLVQVTERDGLTHLYLLPVPVSVSTTPRVIARGRPRGTPRVIGANPARYWREPRALSREESLEPCEPCAPTPDYLEAVAELRRRRLGEA